MPNPTPAARRVHRQAGPPESGFSLIELLITLAIFATVTAGMLAVFDNSGRLARSQTQVAIMHQGQRVGQAELVRFVREAGLGGLPITRLNLPDGNADGIPDALAVVDYDTLGAFPRNGYAVTVLNNIQGVKSIFEVVDDGATDCNAGTDTNCVVPGSDVLIVRGVFSNPLYYVEPPLDPAALLAGGLDNDDITIPGKIRVAGKIWQDYPQDLQALVDWLSAAKARTNVAERGEALILRDTLNPNAYAVVEFDHANINLAAIQQIKCLGTGLDPTIPAEAADIPNCVTFPLRLNDAVDPGKAYADLSTGSILDGTPGAAIGVARFPSRIGSIGVLEEYRFFVRINWDPQPPPLKPRLSPVLSRARFLPGTNVQVGSIVDIAEGVIDLQIAVGADADAFGSGPGYGRVNDLGTQNDEVLFNAALDDPGSGVYAAPPNGLAAWYDPAIEFHFLRINTLVESAERDLRYLAPELLMIEDTNRGAAFTINGGLETNPIDYNSGDRRRFRRRWLRTVVEMRNLL